MSRIIRIGKALSLLFLSFFGCLLAIILCYWLAENFFFDKFFYRKSLSHGYWTFADGDHKHFESFGKRGTSILALLKTLDQGETTPVLGTQDTDEFTIAVFGDSYTWGLGVREDQIFSSILEKELSKVRPSKVMNFSMEGDNVIDHWRKLQLVEKSGQKIDLYIFGVVHNDALLKRTSVYGYHEQSELDACDGDEVFDITEDASEGNIDEIYAQRIEHSTDSGTKNACILDKLLKRIPQVNALYVDLDSLLTTDPATLKMGRKIAASGLPTLTFKPLDLDKSPLQESLFVSKQERHPSARAHSIYAQEISKVILTRSEFNFAKE